MRIRKLAILHLHENSELLRKPLELCYDKVRSILKFSHQIICEGSRQRCLALGYNKEDKVTQGHHRYPFTETNFLLCDIHSPLADWHRLEVLTHSRRHVLAFVEALCCGTVDLPTPFIYVVLPACCMRPQNWFDPISVFSR